MDERHLVIMGGELLFSLRSPSCCSMAKICRKSEGMKIPKGTKWMKDTES